MCEITCFICFSYNFFLLYISVMCSLKKEMKENNSFLGSRTHIWKLLLCLQLLNKQIFLNKIIMIGKQNVIFKTFWYLYIILEVFLRIRVLIVYLNILRIFFDSPTFFGILNEHLYLPFQNLYFSLMKSTFYKSKKNIFTCIFFYHDKKKKIKTCD